MLFSSFNFSPFQSFNFHPYHLFNHQSVRIVFRNFTRTLAAGTFNADEQAEPMSDFKWHQLLNAAQTLGVSEYAVSGMMNIAAANGTMIPATIQKEIAINTTETSEEQGAKESERDAKRQQARKFTNFFLNRKYNQLVYNEIHSIDTSIDTITLINLLISNMSRLISAQLDINRLADLGLFLRNNGNRIDFIKAERWIRALKMNRAANTIGSYLIILYGFSVEELPFMKRYDKRLYDKAYATFCTMLLSGEHPFTSQQSYADDTIRIDTTALKHLKILPSEALSRYFTSVFKKLTNIEE